MITKSENKKGNTVNVEFSLPAEAATKNVSLVGSFNGWDSARHPMRLDRTNGRWSRTVRLDHGQKVQFRYLVDETEWLTDDEADAREPNGFGSENGVLEL